MKDKKDIKLDSIVVNEEDIKLDNTLINEKDTKLDSTFINKKDSKLDSRLINEEDNKNLAIEEERCAHHQHSPIKHMLHMILCCGLPILIILALPLIAGFSPAAATILGFIAPFICPIMMGGMLFMMFGNKKKKYSHNYMMKENESRRY